MNGGAGVRTRAFLFLECCGLPQLKGLRQLAAAGAGAVSSHRNPSSGGKPPHSSTAFRQRVLQFLHQLRRIHVHCLRDADQLDHVKPSCAFLDF